MRAPITAAFLLAIASPAYAAFNPVDFFKGRTHGEGMLKIIFQSAKKMSVDSEGFSEKDGSLVLKQIIHEPGKPPRTRYWRMRQTAPNRFEGTLTDAASAVRVDVLSKGIRIRYTAKDNLNFDQMLTQVGAKEVHNLMRVKRFGFTVANYDETIRKLD